MAAAHDYDVFVSHASEDKEAFVRPLVERLAAEHLEVWFDEMELRVGDSLVQTINRGLARSRFGLVVISPAFLSRPWPQAELSALTQREMATGDSVLLPIWLGVGFEDVARTAPLLADRFAVIADRGLDYTVSALMQRIKPGRSPIVLAREILADRGTVTPPPNDPFWLDVAESSSEPDYIDIHSGLLRWGFPLPDHDGTAESRAERLAQTVMRDDWMAEADRRPISQITHPDVVHQFIREMPGLLTTAAEHPRYLACYAPQLLLPGFGGPFEASFDAWLERELASPRPDLETIGWHLRDLTGADAVGLACDFVQGELMGPSVKFYDETFDYFLWALSDDSLWIPPDARELLIRGMRDWAVWPPSGRRGDAAVTEAAEAILREARKVAPDFARLRDALLVAARESHAEVCLSTSPEELVERLIACGAVDALRRDRRRDDVQRRAGS